MPLLILGKKLQQCDEVLLLIGQSFDNDTYYVYDTLILNHQYNVYYKDFSIKQNLFSFIEQIQEVTTMISFGLKPVGLIFPEQSIQMTNLNILKKISQALNVQKIFYGTIEQIEQFDLQNLKISKVIKQLDQELQIKIFNYTRQINIKYSTGDLWSISSSKYVNQMKSCLQQKKLLLNSQIVANEQDIYKSYNKDENVQVQFLEAQSEDALSNQDQNLPLNQKNVIGYISLKVYGNQYIDGIMIRDLLIKDLEDQLSLRVITGDFEDFILQRVEFTLSQNVVSFQDFKKYQSCDFKIDQKISMNFESNTIGNTENCDEQPSQQSHQTKETIQFKPNENELGSQSQQEKVQIENKKQNFKGEYYLMCLFVLLLSVGLGLRML